MGFAVAAYVVVWIVLFLYVLRLTGKNRKLTQEVEGLKGAIAERRKE